MNLLLLGLGPAELLIVTLLFGNVIIGAICYWRIFERAGEPGWAAIIPIVRTITILKIIDRPWWWFLLMLIPFIGIIWAIWALNLLVIMHGKSSFFTFGVLLLPMIFLPILAFGKNTFGEASDADILDINN